MQLSPYKIPFHGNQIKMISVKESNAIALGVNGLIYTWGKNARICDNQDEMAEDEFCSTQKPELVKPLFNYKHEIYTVVCGDGFFVVTTKNKYNILTWGYKSTYIRNKNTIIVRVKGMHLGLTRKIENVVATNNSCSVLLSTGEIYSWGKANQELGRYILEQNDNKVPMNIVNIPCVRSISGGTTHVAALDIHGSIYVWGNIDSIFDTVIPFSLELSNEDKQYVYVKSGIDSILAIDNENKTWVMGKNQGGKLSNIRRNNIMNFEEVNWY